MTIDRKIYKAFYLSLVLVLVAGGKTAEAGRVKIINESNLNLRVDVVTEPGEASYCKQCFDRCSHVRGKHMSAIIVPANAFGNCGYFSMLDARSGFLGSGKCRHLSVLKDYEVTFSETSLGTFCEYKEI